MNDRILIFLLLYVFNFPLFAAQPIFLDSVSSDYLIKGNYFDLFEDTSRTYSFEKIKINSDQLFTNDHESIEKVHQVKSNYWLRFNCISSNKTEKKIIEVITPQTENLTLYTPKLDGTYSSSTTGYLHPYNTREYNHKNFIFDFQQRTDFTKPFYLKVNSSNKVGLLLKIRSQKYFTAYSLKEYLTLGVYYGILLLLIVYNLILFFYLQKRVYLAYTLVVLFAIGLSMSDDGMGFALIWSNHPTWSQVLGLDIFPLFFLISYTLYATEFLTINLAKQKKIILVSTSFYLVYFALQILFSKEKFYYSFIYSIPFITIYFSYWYAAMKYKFKAAYFFILGNTFALTGIVVEQLRLLEVLEGNVITVYAFEMGIVLEFLSLSFSMAYQTAEEEKRLLLIQEEKLQLAVKNEEIQEKVITVLKEKEQLNQKVNIELETKVQERTKAVQEANDKLTKLVNDLESMSITLDKENWQLKHVIKEEKTSRLKGNKVTLEEVHLLFPTKLSCLKFLEEIKWTGDFICNKCQHPKSSINSKDRSRKCSKCGKIESVTSGSLFHAQKMPLQTLFLLTHLSFGEYAIDVSTLSNQTNVSENSIYKFLTKVKVKKKECKGAKSWEEIIF